MTALVKTGSARPKTRWHQYRLPIACLLSFLTYTLLSITYGELHFENALDSLLITFNDFEDFGPSYKAALTAAGKESFDYSFLTWGNTTTSSTIPPIVHFIWFQDLYNIDPEANEMPHLGANTPDLCMKYNPYYQVNVWNETASRDLLEKNYAWFLPTYDTYKYPIQRVDAIKYFILYHYGGVYLDMDVSCRKGLDPLLNFPAWFPRASPIGVNNDVMASRPGHPLMWKMIDSLRPRNKNLLSSFLTIYWSTGPRYTSDMLRTFLHEHGIHGAAGSSGQEGAHFKRSSDANAVYVLPQEFYSEQYTFFGHRPGGTWYGEDVAMVLWLVKRPLVVVMGFLLIATFVFVATAKKCRARVLRTVSSTRGQFVRHRYQRVRTEEMEEV